MLWIRDTSSVPPEGWTYTVQATGYQVRAPNYGALFGMIRTHCESNNVPVPSEQDVIDVLCRELSIPCVEMDTRTPLVNRFVLGIPAPAPSCCGSKK